MKKLLYILKGIAIALPLAVISGSLAQLISYALKLYSNVHFHRAWIRDDEFLNFLSFQLLYIVIYPIGFEFLRKRVKLRLIFTVSCLLLYYAAIIYSGFFNYTVENKMRAEVFLYPLIAVFIRELILGKLLTYLWRTLKELIQKIRIGKQPITEE